MVSLNLDSQTIIEEMLELEEFFKKQHLFVKPSPKILPFREDRIEGGYIDGIILEEKLNDVFSKYGVYSIQDVKIPIAIPSVDLITGKMLIFTNDKDAFDLDIESSMVIEDIPIAKAVRASASIPFVFSHVDYEGYRLVDGGVRLNVPVPLLKRDGIPSLAITTKKELEPLSSNSIKSIGMQVYQINNSEFDLYLARLADFHINIPLGNLQFSIGKGRSIIEHASLHLSNDTTINEIIFSSEHRQYHF